MGGWPDLPASIPWPFETERPLSGRDRFFNTQNTKSLGPLSFIAQLNLSEISALDEDGLLPKSGWLYFFYSDEQDVWGFDPRDSSGFKVLYFDGDRAELMRNEFPEGLSKYSRFSPCVLNAVRELSLPGFWSNEIDGFFRSAADRDAFYDLREDGIINKVLGYADAVQNEMELECEIVTNGFYTGDGIKHDDPRRKSEKQAVADWRLLLQVDSNDDCGMMWGDVGRIYFWIRKEDLLNRRFDKSWFQYQCC